jgi:hypothetical protein
VGVLERWEIELEEREVEGSASTTACMQITEREEVGWGRGEWGGELAKKLGGSRMEGEDVSLQAVRCC